MGGSAVDEEWELASSNEVRTVVLVGKTGNGKSATGNSILGRDSFKSKFSSSGVTSTCELKQTVMDDGLIVNVIDTPGLFDFAPGTGKEIVKCIDLAKDGIHAILVVFSVTCRFSQEEEAVLRCLQSYFGDKITRYMIIVFTGGDILKRNDQTLEGYLAECPQPLQELLALCGNRVVLFSNGTKDEHQRVEKVQELLSLVDSVIAQNGGRPYTDELFAELKKGAMKLSDEVVRGFSEIELSEFKVQIEKSYEEQLQRSAEMVESKLRETTARLQQQLAEEQAVRLKAEENAKNEIHQLRESLKSAQEETNELRKQVDAKGGCNIL